MPSPFDDHHGQFYVLRNEEGQFSLWPDFADIPSGWHSVSGPVSRDSALGYIEGQWTDMRPTSARA
ncbi:MbtH family protein [Streptomyces sp. WI04-05B]|uniref:MbtH-like protein n=1 Tax=Streptomyces turgidiscabies (strain Car8) TaxID=698760 RepID=L7F3A3_STRT8|nr:MULTISPECIES: MbtH family NRPS accessory protein [Streptomyces]ELP65807.1 MbtH-like protein [Streptomyces turgidiscabies Car8]MDX2548223.1 MbtH family NRPS accessory protein [Streptomyces sp. WI04-05B]MDX2590260.1 MbtH family NRPS accessory protein [Streptomyces sp. WI04-05A]MDX3500012.1 MbtH family NRPS accessory protein [Streptomyces turgidiscabies]GAQ77365.1 MbtH-like protein [Streptomyces turgidiscabies]